MNPPPANSLPPTPATPRVTTSVESHPVPAAHRFNSPHHGAELCFRGVVRGTEAGQPIRGIRYSAYLPMAQATLASLAAAVAEEHPNSLIFIHHTLGEVAAGEASLLLAVATPHSAESLTLLEKLLRRLKSEVPIWKQPMPVVSPTPPTPTVTTPIPIS
jgi:molybdopterin synthase catalytic subunit